jgi:hypothetical protein
VFSVSTAQGFEAVWLGILLSKLLQQMLHVNFGLIWSIDWSTAASILHTIKLEMNGEIGALMAKLWIGKLG